MKHNSSPFKWRHYQAGVILLCVRWYCRYALNYRNLEEMIGADHHRLPFSISVDNHASYPDPFSSSQEEKILPLDCKLRRVKCLNNIVEQDHRAITR